MDQKKIGKLIASKRKEKKLTQKQLAEKLGVTNKAVSKWENGKSIPDIGIIQDLCKILDITVTTLLNGAFTGLRFIGTILFVYGVAVFYYNYKMKKVEDRS